MNHYLLLLNNYNCVLKYSYHTFEYVGVYDNDWDLNPKPDLWNNVGNNIEWSIVFVDHRPGDRRKDDIIKYKDIAEIIVVHDTQQDTYQYEPTLSLFKYRYDYKIYTTYTTLVSNTIDVKLLF
jgi:hypothetical protein